MPSSSLVLILQRKEALAYGVYSCTNTFLPTAVAAVVLFYGGSLVLQGHMSAGALVSFMLYQQSLASAFQVPNLPLLTHPGEVNADNNDH